MGAGKHGHIAQTVCKLKKFVVQTLQRGHHNLCDGIEHHQRESCVVDILRREAEVDEFFILAKTELIEASFEIIFHSLYVVVGGFLYLFDFLSFFRCEHFRSVDFAQCFLHLLVYSRELRQTGLREGDEIFNLHQHTVADNCIFGEVSRERFCL